jgi:hypothetical protein
MELENMQVVDGTRPKNRLSLKKPGKLLGFDTKFDTKFGPRADSGGSAQFLPDKRACRERERTATLRRTTWILAMVTAAFLYRR